jgi:putative N6-adenine-specific DNA methylase
MDLFVVTANGLPPIVLREMEALGIRGTAVAGGVEAEGALREVASLNLWLRCATRVLVRLGSFRATAFPELVRKAAALPWEEYLRPSAKLEVRATCHKSRLYHSGGVAERILSGLEARVRGAGAARAGQGGQLVLARFDHDICTVSIDSSGELLHQRGWRGPQAKAPLRETLAAALLLAAGYTGDEPFCDPLCGSGTIAIEAALIAARRAPGLQRRFAFESWPRFDGPGWEALRQEARAREQPPRCPIEASDQDAGAVAAARENAQGAGVQIRIAQRRLSELPADAGAGLLACNPPYGVRVAAGDVWRDLGEALRRRASWRAAAVVGDERKAAGARLPWRAVLRTENGGLPVALMTAEARQ